MTVYRSAKVLENNLRALEACDEALKVRNARETPVEYANTIANKSNVIEGSCWLQAWQGSMMGTTPSGQAWCFTRQAFFKVLSNR